MASLKAHFQLPPTGKSRSRARSRLKSRVGRADRSLTGRADRSFANRSSLGQFFGSRSGNWLESIRQRLLIISLVLPGFGGAFYILNNIYPQDIAHWGWPNLYLPLQFFLGWGNFFLITGLTLSVRRGVVWSLVLGGLLFLKLQRVVFESSWLVPFLISFVIIELIFTIIGWWRKR